MPIQDVGDLPDNPLEMPPPYWRGSSADFHIAYALEDLSQMLNELVSLNQQTDARLQEYFSRHPQPPEDDPEFGEICRDLWDLEHRIKLKAEVAILMAAISSEDHLNMTAVFNLHRDVVEPLEKLSPPDKLQVVSAFLDKPGIKGEKLYADVKRLTAWRNAFAHGHCVDRPTKSLRHNHLIEPSDLPGVPSLVADALDLVACYVDLVHYSSSISNNDYTAGPFWDVERIKEQLQQISRYRFKGSNWVYEVYFE